MFIYVQVGLQELTEAVPDFEQDGVSLYANPLLDKQNEWVDNLDDSLCEDENAKEIDCLVPSKEDLTQLTNSENIADHLVNMEKNYNLVDELFDGCPTVSHNPNSSDNTVSLLNENFDKKIAPLFTSTKKNKRFRAPVQSIVVENTGRQSDDKNRIESCDTQIEKAKPVFKSGTKSSTGKKRKLSETSKGEDETISKPPVKRLKSDKSKKKSCEPANSNAEAKQTSFDIEEKAVMSSDDLVTKVSSTTSKEVSSTAEKVRKKKGQKKTIEDENEETAIDGVKKLTPCEQPDRGKSTQSCDIKTGKAKPMFKLGTKSSIGKKQKLSETSKDGDENISDPPASGDGEAKEINFTIKEGTDVSSNDSVKEAEASSSSTSKQVLPTVERINKKRKQKKATDCKDKKAAGDAVKNKKETNASKKKAAQQQAKIDMSCKNLDREQRKAEKELQKISRELEKVRKQKSNKGKKPVEMNKPTSSSSSGQLWVQCDQPDCLKWRRLKHCENPSEIPEKWFCSMNPGEYSIRICVPTVSNALHSDQHFNSCAVSEEEYSDLSDSQEYVYATYAPGAIVWAKITGYPWCVCCDNNALAVLLNDTSYTIQVACYGAV